VTKRALIREHTFTKEYVLVHNVKLVHNIEIRLVTKISITALARSEKLMN